MRKLVLVLLLTSGSCFASMKDSEVEFSRQIVSFMVVRDFAAAIDACSTGLKIFPDSQNLKGLMIRVLSESGRTNQALELYWKERKTADLKENFTLVESVAWGVLLGDEEMSERTRLMTLIGAYLTRDSRAVNLILEALRSTNAFLRSFAIDFAAHYNDRVLQKEVLALLKEEKNWYVRSRLLSAVGAMRLEEAEPYLKEVIESKATTHEEKALAIQSLISIFDEADADEIELLLLHKRSGMRELGVAIIDHFGLVDQVEKLIPLLKDSSPSIRMMVLGCLGTIGIDGRIYQKIDKAVEALTADSHPEVAVMAYWLSLQYNQEFGRGGLKVWVKCPDVRSASFAASVIGAGGKPTSKLLSEMFDQVENDYVKVNLAYGMIKQGVEVVKARKFLSHFLRTHREKLMWANGVYPMFTTLTKSEVRHVPHIPSYPAMVDQMTRLELLNTLCIIESEEAKELVKAFLTNHIWGVVGSAAVVVLEEGDMEGIEIIRELLNDPDESVRIQAALALAFYGGDASVVRILEEMYPKLDWDKKISVLEAMGFIGSRTSVDFLLQVLEEPFQLLRTIAASSIIQCLYH